MAKILGSRVVVEFDADEITYLIKLLGGMSMNDYKHWLTAEEARHIQKTYHDLKDRKECSSGKTNDE